MIREAIAVIVADVVVSVRMPVAVLSAPAIERVIVIWLPSPSSSMQVRTVSSCSTSKVLT